jgi:CheY-like chemotaxis protein
MALLAERSSARILIADDSPADVLLTKRAFGSAGANVEFFTVGDGEECLQFLDRSGAYQDAPQVDIVLLDINMPRMGGVEVMQAIAEKPDLDYPRFVAFSTSKNPDDVRKMYTLGCASYWVKPGGFHEFTQAARSFCDYWFKTAELPNTTSLD